MVSISNVEVLSLLAQNWGLTASSWFNNVLYNNMLATSNFSADIPTLSRLAEVINAAFLGIHVLMSVMFLRVLSRLQRRVFSEPGWWLLAFSAIHIALSGISYAQGDRLVVTAMPFWVTGYCWLISKISNDLTPKFV